jgi:hypothetical protein
VRKVLAAEFFMGDTEDPEIYAAEPISQWQKTPQGQWFMQYAHDPTFHILNDVAQLGHRVAIYGSLSEQDEIIFRLKWC